MRRQSVSHLAVFSVSIPSSSASTSAAAAEGASPITDPGPWAASQTARSPAMAVVFPVPAGPTSTSSDASGRGDLLDGERLVDAQPVVAARAGSPRDRRHDATLTRGPPASLAASSRRASASRIAAVV